MSRVGKIARLPEAIREELNRRLADGQPGSKLLRWLDGLPAVKEVMAEHFGGAAVTKQNLSEWRRGGFADWRIERDVVARARELPREADDLEAAAGGDITRRLTTVVAAHYAGALAGWDGESNQAFRARLKVLRELSRPIVALRGEDLRAERIKLERERLEYAWEKLGDQAERGHSCPQQVRDVALAKAGDDFADEFASLFADSSATGSAAAEALALDSEGHKSDGSSVLPPFREADGSGSSIVGEGKRNCGWKARPLPGPVASQARHKIVSRQETCASRIVVPQDRANVSPTGRETGTPVDRGPSVERAADESHSSPPPQVDGGEGIGARIRFPGRRKRPALHRPL